MSVPRVTLTGMRTTDDRTRADERASGAAASAPVIERTAELPPDHPLAVLRRHSESRGAHWLLSAVHAAHALEDVHAFADRHAEHIDTPGGTTLAEANDLRRDLDGLEDDDLEWLTPADIALALVELRKARTDRSATAAELAAAPLAALILAAAAAWAHLEALAHTTTLASADDHDDRPPPPTLEALTTSTLTAAPPAPGRPVPGARRAVLVTAC